MCREERASSGASCHGLLACSSTDPSTLASFEGTTVASWYRRSPTMDAKSLETHALLIGPALAFTAGFADASTFVGADGIFCAHVTGNFVVLAADLALHARGDEWLKLATFPIFVAAVLVSTWVHRRTAPVTSPPAARALLAAKSLLFGLAAAVAWLVPTSEPGVGRVAVVALLVTAMGIQNAIHRLNPVLGPMTTVMTGNVTAWFVDAFTPATPEGARKRRDVGLVIVSFAAGCAAGALGVARFGFPVLVVPTAVTLFARSQLHP
jgi:uncharacterized membrane protein YoaK (UPF0700 family)